MLKILNRDLSLIKVESMSQLVSNDKSRTRVAIGPQQSSMYVYPGKHGAVQKAVVVPRGDSYSLEMAVSAEGLTEVIDPKRVTPQAIELLRTYHESHLRSEFVNKVFIDEFMVLPYDEIMCVLTDKGKTFVLSNGWCWEIVPPNKLVHVRNMPSLEPVNCRYGVVKSSSQPFTYVSQSVYVDKNIVSEVLLGTTTVVSYQDAG